ncbi:chitin biosynthesis protein CHS6 [Kluyveromyces marxianus]|uniref:Chitin biosynthesis protein CHS6 n=2 Tax=Kluyveromyces marxianus TaxID=4911 RepID=W0T9H9_KLUMD|nr:chitin biosynthesis protein CHS6 [Kluyveromyces marxianus DMKU3-1042]QGN15168.1 chitin biosynthesis protein CHS6 [Kluyveromyces marxianus]BAO39451.1 chitin biosynthesis protein CHS6 [Kluyveromyces marxianus DMKU3-1042]BAP70950.1 chitin biosynthesis protein CHS6 [Kluyveromyces marxianus]
MNMLWKSKKKKSTSRPGSVVLTDQNGGAIFDDLPGEKKRMDDNPRIMESQFGESLGLRMSSLRKLLANDTVSLGFPDLVHVAHYDKSRKDEIGEYHYITGIDCSSEAMPIGYLSTLRLSQNWANETISTFCCYNLFSKLDLRIKFENEKAFQVSAIECSSGTQHVPMSEVLWKETFISGVIRAMIFNKDREWKLPGMVEVPVGIDNGIGSAQSIVKSFCEFIPRYKETGTDLSHSPHVSPLNNYLVDALLSFLAMTPRLHHYCISILEEFTESDPKHAVLYQLVKCKVAFKSENSDLLTASSINALVNGYFKDVSKLKKSQLIMLTDLLNLQTEFLIKKSDYNLALPVALYATQLVPDTFNSWYNLADCYIHLKDYESALLAINSVPKLLIMDPCKDAYWSVGFDKLYYRKPQGQGATSSLSSHEYNYALTKLRPVKEKDMNDIVFGKIIMPANSYGCVKSIFENACAQIGPVYGPKSNNLIDFVSNEEIGAVAYTALLERNSLKNKLPWYMQQMYRLLMKIVNLLGWNGLLELRSSIFVMESEHLDYQKRTNPSLRKKRMCEKWLDTLFMEVYQDLKVSLNSPALKDSKSSGLEWELLGLLLVKTANWNEAVACLRTSIMARFDVVAADTLLGLFLSETGKFPLTIDEILSILLGNCSYHSRFYDACQWQNLQVLYKLNEEFGTETLRNRIYAHPMAEKGIVTLIDKCLDWIQQFA